MEKYEFTPCGVCSSKIIIEHENGVVLNVKFIGGCPGNTQGVAALCKGMKIQDIIDKLDGIRCGFKSTSCPNELAKALKNILSK